MRSQRAVTVAFGDFGIGALGGGFSRDPSKLSCSLRLALRYYLASKESGRLEWPYPTVRRDGSPNPAVELQFEVDDAIWKEFSGEANRQGVSAQQLLQHAVLYFAADRDCGRLAVD
jgi:hypothetical protein